MFAGALLTRVPYAALTHHPRVSPGAPRLRRQPEAVSRLVVIVHASSSSSSSSKKRQTAAQEDAALLALAYTYDDEDLSLTRSLRQSHARAAASAATEATRDQQHADDRRAEDEAADAAEAAFAASAADAEKSLAGARRFHHKKGAIGERKSNGPPPAAAAAAPDKNTNHRRVAAHLERTGRLQSGMKLSDVVKCTYKASDRSVHKPRYRCVLTYLEERVLLQDEEEEERCPEAKAVVGRWCAGRKEAKEDALGALFAWLTAEDNEKMTTTTTTTTTDE